MTDLAKQLRDNATVLLAPGTTIPTGAIAGALRMAADEIQRLREDLRRTESAHAVVMAENKHYKQVAAGRWQPIETAPRDGRLALVYRPLAEKSHDRPVDVKRLISWDNHCWPCTVPAGQEPYNPTDGACHVTHWMPLPEGPSQPPGDG